VRPCPGCPQRSCLKQTGRRLQFGRVWKKVSKWAAYSSAGSGSGRLTFMIPDWKEKSARIKTKVRRNQFLYAGEREDPLRTSPCRRCMHKPRNYIFPWATCRWMAEQAEPWRRDLPRDGRALELVIMVTTARSRASCRVNSAFTLMATKGDGY